ncbi:LytR C-terminal domain-containing protein [Sinomonas sp. ASV486]|uniref:LytR C-terminal domain-containing protein n=1 Tax=Sinomonas sp. ASV486 TaxID=3051170 RepID=UPI0027DD29F2|nr:LytR C-terminal domain-containing protein [Sinomonas sp. ASV486]MDQ4490872.1 LytR C-terminal domain-containing protein [Sinomonas sp. ASV486]
MNMYSRDEFDAIPESPRRQGVHRTRGETSVEGGGQSGRGLRWILAAGLIALVIGALAFFVLPRLGLSGTTAAASSSQKPTSGAPSAAPSSSAPSQAASSAAPPPSAKTTAPPAADKTLEVGVYNATATGGLGTRAATAARSAGWAVSTVGNWGGAPVSASVVYYKTAAQADSAKALAADLGIATVQEAPALGLPLAVVVGPGFGG